MDLFPVELILKIFEFLDIEKIIRFSKINKYFQEIINNNFFWKSRLIRDLYGLEKNMPVIYDYKIKYILIWCELKRQIYKYNTLTILIKNKLIIKLGEILKQKIKLDNFLQSQLVEMAIDSGCPEILEMLNKYMDIFNILFKSPDGQIIYKSPLLIAMATGNINMVKFYYEKYKTKKKKYNNPELLYWIFNKRDFDLMEFLLENQNILKYFESDFNINKKYYGRTLLYYAISENSEPITRILLFYGANINIYPDNLPLIFLPVKNNNYIILKYLLDYGGDKYINYRDNYKYTPLYWACKKNLLNIIILLLKYGSKINYLENNPFWFALENNNYNMVILLLEYGADIYFKDGAGYSAIHKYCQSDNYIYGDQILEYLLSLGVNINLQDNSGFTPLYISIIKNYYFLADYILEKKPDINIPNIFGKTALHAAIYNNNMDILELLLADTPGINLNCLDESGNTPCHYAIYYADPEILDLLLKSGANPYYKNNINYLPINLACQKDLELVKIIIPYMDPDIPILVSCLELACESNKPDILEYLINLIKKFRDFYPEKNTGYLNYLLCQAAQKNNLNIMDILLKNIGLIKKLNIIKPKYSIKNNSTYHAAAQMDNFNIIKLLAKYGKFDINCKNLDGDTPLALACQYNSLESAKFLIIYGADNIPNNNNINPLYMACDNNPVMADILLYIGRFDLKPVKKNSPFHALCKNYKNLGLIKSIVWNNKNINKILEFRDNNNYTPLYIACVYNCLEIFKFLINFDKQIKYNYYRASLYFLAKQNKFIHIINFLDKYYKNRSWIN